LNQPSIVSLVSSAAMGEALLFLATNSPVALTDRRVVLVRELARLEVRRVMGVGEASGQIPRRLQAGEPMRILNELRRAAAYGTTSAVQRYRTGSLTAHAVADLTRPAA
jgi:hypothetical protein